MNHTVLRFVAVTLSAFALFGCDGSEEYDDEELGEAEQAHEDSPAVDPQYDTVLDCGEDGTYNARHQVYRGTLNPTIHIQGGGNFTMQKAVVNGGSFEDYVFYEVAGYDESQRDLVTCSFSYTIGAHGNETVYTVTGTGNLNAP